MTDISYLFFKHAKRNFQGLAYSLFIALVSLPSFANPVTAVPDNIAGITTVNAEGLLETVEAMPELILIDSRIQTDRRHGLIETSISLPDIETNCDTLNLHIPSMDNPILFYCNGVKCGRSVVAANTAKKCGYTQIFWFRGGFEEWREKGYPVVQE